MSDNDIRECLRIEGLVIPLDQVSGNLRLAYEQAQRAVKTSSGPQRNVNKAAVTKIAQQILAEYLPKLCLKHNPRSFGAAGYFEAMAKRSLTVR